MTIKTNSIEMDKERLKKFIKKDRYMKFLFNELKQNGNNTDRSLEILYALLLDDINLQKGYRMV